MKIEGMAELLNKLESYQHPEHAKNMALDVGAEHLRAKVAASTPRSQDTPNDHAADHIVVKKDGDNRYIGPDRDHWMLNFPEFGSVHQPAQGFMSKTFHREVRTTQDKMADSIRKDLRL
jgi:HK97 gp10 family phage protein